MDRTQLAKQDPRSGALAVTITAHVRSRCVNPRALALALSGKRTIFDRPLIPTGSKKYQQNPAGTGPAAAELAASIRAGLSGLATTELRMTDTLNQAFWSLSSAMVDRRLGRNMRERSVSRCGRASTAL
jgi:hypothetical protein